MEPARFIIAALKVFLSIGLACGYGNLVQEMGRAAVHAQTQKPFSAAKFNRLLWTKSKTQNHSTKTQEGGNQ